ncbi:hypothetical protein ALP92_200067 [Pseudomonas syringae pv. primulae]|uniref:Uncharacterized protein n=1 Tax=Pseudomonas syringae pv. primulae TaxID=251707 RepID=A0A3M4RQW9_9PSED|nr:hypothetical protein ALP92_200067 [Pseudomonas syringae pv. primulae]
MYVCELAHEEAGADAENLLISQSDFASKLAPTQAAQSRVWELAHEEAGADAENLLISQFVFASKLAPTEATQSRVWELAHEEGCRRRKSTDQSV